jgi:hypothetical protein
MQAGDTPPPSGSSVEELLDWRPELGVLTVSVAIDPGDRGQGWLTALRNDLNAAVRPADDGHDRGRALRATAQRILDRFGEDRLPSGRVQLGFCQVSDGRNPRDVWIAAELTDFRTSVSYDERPRLTPLLKLLDEGAAVGAVAISSERVHLYEWRLGALELIQDWEIEIFENDWRETKGQRPADPASTQGVHSTGKDQFDRRLEHNRARFLKEVGGLSDHESRERGWRRLIAFGDPEHFRELADGVEKGIELELGDTVDVINEKRGRVLERVNAAITKGNDRRALALIERAVEGARTPDGHGALGVTDVQRALDEGRVERLIFDADTPEQELADVEDEIVERAIRTSAQVTPVEDTAAEALREHGGVAAILRY